MADEKTLVEYHTAIADRTRYAGFLKGLPEDKQIEELHITRLVFPDAESVEPTPTNPPDVRVVKEKRIIGVEIRELVDQKMVELHMRRRSAERKIGLTAKEAWDADQRAFRAGQAAARAAREAGHDPKEAFWKTYTANHPTPDHVSPDAVSEHWNPHTLAAELDRIIEEKDRKLIGRTDGYEEVWLAIHTGEPMIDLVMIAATKELRKYHPSQIDGVVLVLDYRPWLTRNDGNYPMIEIF